MRPYDSVAPQLGELLRTAGTDRVIDLCSGSGGPWRTLLPALRAVHGRAEVVLNDLHPTPGQELPPGVHYRDTPVDATRLPEELTGVRTLFDGLHHFPLEQARALHATARPRGTSLHRVSNGPGVGQFVPFRPIHFPILLDRGLSREGQKGTS